MLGIRQTTDGEDAFDSGNGIVRRTDLRRAYVELTQPDRRIIGIESHGAIVQEGGEKAKATTEGAHGY